MIAAKLPLASLFDKVALKGFDTIWIFIFFSLLLMLFLSIPIISLLHFAAHHRPDLQSLNKNENENENSSPQIRE
jgi:hypothetical protein